MFPDVNFLVYHAGYVPTAKEGPYDRTRSDGVDRLIDGQRSGQVGLHQLDPACHDGIMQALRCLFEHRR